MSHFHREPLQQSEQEHQGTVTTTFATKGSTFWANKSMDSVTAQTVMSNAKLTAMAKKGKDAGPGGGGGR
jgi:hypothetical protein